MEAVAPFKSLGIDFMVVGFPKSGTTQLARNLNAHPNVSISLEDHLVGKGFIWQRDVDSIRGKFPASNVFGARHESPFSMLIWSTPSCRPT